MRNQQALVLTLLPKNIQQTKTLPCQGLNIGLMVVSICGESGSTSKQI